MLVPPFSAAVRAAANASSRLRSGFSRRAAGPDEGSLAGSSAVSFSVTQVS